MKTLNLKISTEGFEPPLEGDVLSVVMRVIQNVVLLWANQRGGMTEEERRKYYKICDVLDDAKKEKKEEIDIDDDWYEFLQRCFKEIKIVPDLLFRRIEEKLF